jgi:hypothetical protein
MPPLLRQLSGMRVYQAVAELPLDLRRQLGYVRKKIVFDLNENIPLNLGFAGEWNSCVRHLSDDSQFLWARQWEWNFLVSFRPEGDCSSSGNPS